VEFVGPIKKTKDKEGFKLKAGIVVPGSSEEEEAANPPEEGNNDSPVDAPQ
jgi:hypothetical protein